MKQSWIVALTVLVAFSCNEHEPKVQVDPQPDPSAKEVLLLGTFHYNNPGADVAKTKSFDILSDSSQNELEQLSTTIKGYAPTQVFVEWPYNEQGELDSLYKLYVDGQYFEDTTLSEFYLKNEIFQLAFRVAKANGLESVKAIDYGDTQFPFGEVMASIEKNEQIDLKKEIEDGITMFTSGFDDKIDSGESLTELTYFLNSAELREFSNHFHINLMLRAGDLEDFEGAYLASEWYRRNLYMWSLIQKGAQESDEKIMVLVGASHAAMMELFIDRNEEWRVRELKSIME